MKRRAFLALLACAAAPAVAAARGIEVIYIGAYDCFYCQHWEAARRPELLEMIRGTPVRLVEIHGETLAKPVAKRHYPAEHRWIYRAIGEVRGVPRFLLAIDGRIVLTVHGTSAYSAQLVPRLRAAMAGPR
jgi:hypothetical protein